MSPRFAFALLAVITFAIVLARDFTGSDALLTLGFLFMALAALFDRRPFA